MITSTALKTARTARFDLIRVATYINTMPEAIAMIEGRCRKGFMRQPANIMGSFQMFRSANIQMALEMLVKIFGKRAFTWFDSYGSL